VLRLVLLPGMDGTGDLFRDFVHALPENFEIKIVRYPTDSSLPYSELTDFVKSATDLSEPYVLIAESFSAPLAIQWAATNPPNLRGLALCAGFATSPVRGLWGFACSLLGPIFFSTIFPKWAIELFLVGPNASPSLVAAVRAAISSVLPKVLSARVRAILNCDARAELSRVAVPVLLLQPKQDRLISGFSLREIRRIIPGAAVEIIDGPHLLLQREPHATADIVARFARYLM
jgi:pimeloyl-[acyl-carrier protein] methyl ester esterase